MTTDLTNVEVGVRFDNDPENNFYKEILDVVRKNDYLALVEVSITGKTDRFYVLLESVGDGSWATYKSCKAADSMKFDEMLKEFNRWA